MTVRPSFVAPSPRGAGHSRTSGYRWLVLGVLWFTLLISYFDRVAIAAALPDIIDDLRLSTTVAGLVSGALFLSYTAVQVPAGAVTDRFGQQRIMAVAIAWWTVFSVLTGAVTGGVLALVAVRFLMGAGEGFHPPPLWRVLSNWFVTGQRAVPLALMLTALTLGPALAPLVAFPVIVTQGWRAVFLWTAVPGVVAVLAVVVLLRDNPARASPPPESPHVEAIGSSNIASRPRRDWRAGHIWLTFGAFFFGFTLYGLLGWLPTYLIRYRGLPIAHAGLASSAPYLAGTVGLLAGGWVCERHLNTHRRHSVAVTYLLAAGCIMVVAIAPSVGTAESALTATGFFLFAGLGPFWSVPMDVVPASQVGTWLGFIKMGTQLSGFLGPILVGWLVTVTGSFSPALITMIASMVLGALCLLRARTPAAAQGHP